MVVNRIWPVNGLGRGGVSVFFGVFLILTGYYSLEAWITAVGRPWVQERLPTEITKLSENERLLRTAREQQALLANPLDSQAIKNLAVLAKVRADPGQFEKLVFIVANRSLRDLTAQAEILPMLLEKKDFAGALYRLDALLRSKIDRTAELLPVAAAFAATEESRGALVDLLTQNPPSRHLIITQIIEKSETPNIAFRLFSDLRKTDSPPSIDEVRQLIQRFVRDSNYETAYYVWLDYLTDVELKKVAQVFDGNFDLEPKNMIFDWTYHPMKNVDLRIVPRTTGSTDRALRIDFVDTRGRFNNFSQATRMASGPHILSGETKSENLETQSGLVWKFYCLGKDRRLIGETAVLPQFNVWSRFATKIDIPPQDCSTQLLRLEVNARAVLDQKLAGRVLMDNIKVTPSQQP